jgi:hypothetical protein
MDIYLQNTPDHVVMQLDVGWGAVRRYRCAQLDEKMARPHRFTSRPNRATGLSALKLWA